MKRFYSLIITLTIVLCSLLLTVSAAEGLTVLQPKNDTVVAKSDLPTLKWSRVDGAAGYRVTVLNTYSGEYIIRNKWTTSLSQSLSVYSDEISGYPLLKIWVGAMASKSDDPALTSISDEIIWIKLSDAPALSVYGADRIDEESARLKMSVDLDRESAIIDSGFYFGRDSDIERMKKYSFSRYGSYDPTVKGTKYLSFSGLEAGTVYYFAAYAVNGAGRSISKVLSFTTDSAKEEISTEVVTLPISGALRTDSSVETVQGYVYKGTYAGRTALVKPYYYLDPARDVEATLDADALKTIIDQFDVLNSHSSSHESFGSGFYYPVSGSQYCTTFTRDVADAYGAAFPSYVCSSCELAKDKKGYMGERLTSYLRSKSLICTCGGKESSLMAFRVGSAAAQNATNDPFCFMLKHGAKYGWERITEKKVENAIAYAREGYLTIGLYSDYDKGAGHVFVVYPSEDSTMHQAQAGAVNAMSDGSLNWHEDGGYRRNPSNAWIEYYVFKGVGAVKSAIRDVSLKDTEYNGDEGEADNNDIHAILALGDLNGNGKRDSGDMVLLAQHLAGWNVSVPELLADMNRDNEVDSADLVLFAQMLAGWNVG